jgi:uncharacterized protein YycO
VGVAGLKIGYPYHRLAAFILLVLGWIPVIMSYRMNRRQLQVRKAILRKKTKPYLPHVVVALVLLGAWYVTWTLFPVEKSPLAGMAPDELRADIDADLESYLMLRQSAGDLVAAFRQNGLLQRKVAELTREERAALRQLWRDGAMMFLEFDLLKGKYKGFYQVDYVAEPALHSDAFMLAYMAYVAQYSACLEVMELIGGDPFMETLLNEEGEGIPADGCFFMRQRLTHPNVLLRLNAAAAYYELVKKDVTFEAALLEEFEQQRRAFLKNMGAHADQLIENPLAVLERAAVEVMLPVQKSVAVQMSYIRTAKRDYLITPDTLSLYRERLEPGDILIQRRNWHLTNVGIPGFWPHVALYIGTPSEMEAYFSGIDPAPLQTLQSRVPGALEQLAQADADGYPLRVIEAIRPGVVFQSLETSARCDYLGVIRPNLSKEQKFKALLAAFSHYGKPYDLNFDFTTDNELVCSELVYKAYRPAGPLPLETEVINGRRLLPPNRLAEQAVAHMGGEQAFSFVLFLDAVEKDDTVVERDEAAFRTSWTRPKWDVLQH